MFDIGAYRKALKTHWMGQEILYFEELESTNSRLKQMTGDEISHGMVCLADHQTKGRGQYERNWESSPAQNLTFTLAFKPAQPERLHVLTLTCARAAVELMEKETAKTAQIKWPNDLILGNKKVAGLLTETIFSGNSLDRVLIGVGFNVNQEKFNESLESKATSLRIENGRSFGREQLLADYLGLIEFYYGRWHKNETELLKSINQKIIGYGQWIKLSINGQNRPEKYKLIGVNERGQLALINKESEVETFSYEQIRLITD